jgi:hypothetical protein
MEDYRYRIGDMLFDTREDAEAWVGAGHIGGTYSIIAQVWCREHDGWFDEMYDATTGDLMCEACYFRPYEVKRRADLAALAAWNSGKPIG